MFRGFGTLLDVGMVAFGSAIGILAGSGFRRGQGRLSPMDSAWSCSSWLPSTPPPSSTLTGSRWLGTEAAGTAHDAASVEVVPGS